MRTILCLVALTLGLGCGAPPPEFDRLNPGADSLSAQIRSSAVELHFFEDWSHAATGPLVAGSTLQVVYDEARLPSCRGDFMGQPGWSISAHWTLRGALEGERSGSFVVAGFDPSSGSKAPEIPLTQAGNLEIWFQVSSRWGCVAYDSNFGKNWKFRVEPAH